MYGCFGSDMTGLAMPGTGMKSSPVGRSGTQPLLGCGVNNGTALATLTAALNERMRNAKARFESLTARLGQ